MDDTQQDNKATTLTLRVSSLPLGKSVESGQLRQNFAHGRSKNVTVEIKKSRVFSKNTTEKPSSTSSVQTSTENERFGRSLTEHERTNRLKVLQQAGVESEKNQTYLAEQQQKEADLIEEVGVVFEVAEQVIDIVIEEVVQPKATPLVMAVQPDKPHQPIVYKNSTSSTAKPELVKKKPTPVEVKPAALVPEASDDKGRFGKKESVLAPSKPKWDDGKKHGKGNLTAMLNDDRQEKTRSMASIRRAREKAKRSHYQTDKDAEKFAREVILPEVITVQELASRMAERAADVIRELMKLGMIVTINQTVDADTAELIIQGFGHKAKRVTESDVENILTFAEDAQENLVSRAPVVTVMGHVDHGKTSLLDALRSTDVVAGEAGGITQHIGAYRIKLATEQYITFLDTPGHEAFTAMRSRGAKATDIVVLVVAADDGIMAQTIEAINHAKAADVPIIVAINKIDKPDADPDRVRNELLTHGLVPEELGGDIIVVEVSAKARINLDKLEEAILLQAEVLDLKANPNCAASGVVIESKVDKGRGIVTTILVQRGSLKLGDIIVAGGSFGKVRMINDDKGLVITEALPSMPVEILGLSETPDAGDQFAIVTNEKQARDIAEFRKRRSHNLRIAKIQRSGLEELFSKASGTSKLKELPLIIKADVQGSLEAIIASISNFPSDEVQIRLLHSAVGGISESDITLANASNAIVLGFNVRANSQAKLLADNESVDLRYYSIIYNLIDDVKAMLSGLLSPILREQYLGTIEIRKVYNITKVGKVAGSYVLDGIIKRGAKVRLLRDNIVIHEGSLKTLKRFKDEVKDVRSGFECGIAFEHYDDIKEKDKVEAFEIIEEKQSL
jgi:translation initiation factor IF-2